MGPWIVPTIAADEYHLRGHKANLMGQAYQLVGTVQGPLSSFLSYIKQTCFVCIL